MPAPSIAGVVLAAGASRRMGELKQLIRDGDRTWVERAASTLEAGGAGIVYVVVGAHASEVGRALPARVRRVHNADWASGQLSSARLGIAAALEDGAECVLLSLVDHPALRPTTVRALLAIDSACAAPCVAARRGHPLRLSAEAARAVLAQDDATSLKDALARAGLVPTLVPVDDVGAVENLNSPGDRSSPA